MLLALHMLLLLSEESNVSGVVVAAGPASVSVPMLTTSETVVAAAVAAVAVPLNHAEVE